MGKKKRPGQNLVHPFIYVVGSERNIGEKNKILVYPYIYVVEPDFFFVN